MTIKLSDLPAEAVQTLKNFSSRDFEMLAIDARHMQMAEEMAEMSSDPLEAVKGANECLVRGDTAINVGDAAGFVESVMEVASTALANPDFDSMDAVHLHRIIRAALDAHHANMNDTREANTRLRAVFCK